MNSPTPHNCLDYLVEHSATSREMHGFSHGPAEVTTEVWHVCERNNGGCGARYTDEEVAEMSNVYTCAQCQTEHHGYPADGFDDMCPACAATWIPASEVLA